MQAYTEAVTGSWPVSAMESTLRAQWHSVALADARVVLILLEAKLEELHFDESSMRVVRREFAWILRTCVSMYTPLFHHGLARFVAACTFPYRVSTGPTPMLITGQVEPSEGWDMWGIPAPAFDMLGRVGGEPFLEEALSFMRAARAGTEEFSRCGRTLPRHPAGGTRQLVRFAGPGQ